MLWWMETRMMPKQSILMEVAPCGSLTRYDQSHIALYAAMMDGEAAAQPWQEVASTLMRLDPAHDGVERCWPSHWQRARRVSGTRLCRALASSARLTTQRPRVNNTEET